jgi:hypothetical protein
VLALAAVVAGCGSPPRPAGILWVSSPNFNEREAGTALDAIVIHTTEGSYEGAIEHFADRASRVSAHYVIGPSGEITQMVQLGKRAWHATYYNSRSIGIEMAGHAARPETWTPANLDALTRLTAWLCDTYDIPPVHPTAVARSRSDRLDVAGIVGHSQVQPWEKSDPGPHFPWGRFIRDVNGLARGSKKSPLLAGDLPAASGEPTGSPLESGLDVAVGFNDEALTAGRRSLSQRGLTAASQKFCGLRRIWAMDADGGPEQVNR